MFVTFFNETSWLHLVVFKHIIDVAIETSSASVGLRHPVHASGTGGSIARESIVLLALGDDASDDIPVILYSVIECTISARTSTIRSRSTTAWSA